jgi:hypothetical protein
MEGFFREVLDRVPLADATVSVLSYVLEESFLEELFQQYRGKCYTRAISFPMLTQLICDALVQNKSGRRIFEKANQEGSLEASVEAAYKKLGRMPVAVSMALLSGGSQRVRELFPEKCRETALPKSLAEFTGVVVDGKVTKGIPHRLKPLRGQGRSLLGGRALVGIHLESGLVLGMVGSEDGDANDVRFLPELTQQIRAAEQVRRLWIADRQFSFLTTLAQFADAEDAFVVRYSKGIPFERDETVAVGKGQDADQRSYEEEWGWLGKAKNPNRRRVRRIRVNRGKQEEFIVVTSLVDAERYPAVDLLEVYRSRTNIEYVFQRITEVFNLRRLIGTSPKATLFQLSLCLLLYNVLQLVRASIASNNGKAMEDVSPKKVLDDLRDELITCKTILGAKELTERLRKPGSAEEVKRHLTERLGFWKKRWTKAKRHRNRPEKPKRRGGHDSAYRLLNKAQEKPSH